MFLACLLIRNLLTAKSQIDPKSSLELLQGPVPCYYEPRDEWLVEFKGLQQVHDRAPTMGTSTTPPYQNQDTATTGSENSHSQQGKRKSHPVLCHPPVKFSKTDGSACPGHDDGPGCTTPRPTGCQRIADRRTSDGSDTIIYAPTLLPHIRTACDIQKTMKGLKELEQIFEADIKRRKIQVEASRTG